MSPNDLNESVRYSATVTLKPRLYQHRAEIQYDMTYPEIVKQLALTGIHKSVIVAELTKNFNIHYHLTITVLLHTGCNINVMKKFVDSFRKSPVFGFVNIKQIEDEKGWIEYISKSFNDFVFATNRRPIIKDDFNYWTPAIYANFGTEW